MFTNYKIMIETVNMSGGYALTVEKDLVDEKSARKKFFDKLSQFGGNPQTKYLRVTLINPYGFIQDMEEINNEVIEEVAEESEV